MALKIYSATLTTSLVTQYTCPAGTEASAHGIVFSNTSASDVTISMTFYKASTASTTTLAGGLSVKAESTFAWPRPLNMGPGDYIQASASTGAVVALAVSVYEGATTVNGFTPQGVWSSAATYAQNDVVSYNGSSYVASQASTNQTPTSPSIYWTLLALAGTNGTNGTSATVAVGTTTTGAAGTSASVTNSGTSSAAVFNFTIPQGTNGRNGMDVFTTGTAATWTIPTGITAVLVTVVGGGGNGGGAVNQRGSGGGAGGVAIKELTGLTPGNTLTYTVGGVGASSTVSSGTQTITTITGGGGTAGTGTAYAASVTAGGAGGTATNGDINIVGQQGGYSWGTGTTVATNVSGTGGSGLYGAGGPGPAIANTAGVNATGRGAGGGGSIGSNTTGNGTGGMVIFEY